ncbi:MAG: hypothetical protein ACE5GS_06810 [Kiloniellaceae bacterium]
MPTLDNLGTHTDGALIAQSQSQKEVTSNALDNLLSNATQRSLGVTISDAPGSPTGADRTLTDDEFFGNFVLALTGSPSVPFALVLPAAGNHAFVVRNDTGQTATVRAGAGSTVDVVAGKRQLLHCDGGNVVALAPPVP